MAGRKAHPWDRIKRDYLKGGTSYAKLAAKYGVNKSTLEKRAIRERWADELQQVCSEVAAEIRRDAVASRVLSAQEVLEEYALIARSDVRHYSVDDAGRLVVNGDAPDDAARAVSSVKLKRTRRIGKDDEEFETVETEIKLWNKNQALQDLGKHLGLFADPGKKGDSDDEDGPPQRFVIEDPGPNA